MKKQIAILMALLAVYIIWGSTYLGMKFAVESIPPLLMAGIRYVVAGAVMFAFLRLRGLPNPTPKQWLNAGWIGVLLLGGANGATAITFEMGGASSVAALVIAITPLFSVFLAQIWGQRASGREWIGILIGILGVAILNIGGDLNATPLIGFLLIFASFIWALGSMWGRQLDMPSAFMASAVEMLIGGCALLLFGFLRGEVITEMPTEKSLWALSYLITFGSLIGFSAYVYLLANVRPALATSHAYVNPLVAVALGVWLGGEFMTTQEWIAMAVVLVGVVLVCWPTQKPVQKST